MSTIQFCNLSRSSYRLVVHEICSSYKAVCISVSSAKSGQILFTVDGMSLKNSINSSIANTEPWGTPLATGDHVDLIYYNPLSSTS